MANVQSSSIEFPGMCLQAPTAARRRLTAIATAWGAQYRKSGDFPELETVPVEPPTLVFTESAFDLDGRPGVRIYLIDELFNEVQRVLGYANVDTVGAALEAGLQGKCWGAVALVILRRPDTIDSLRARIDALAPCWLALDRHRYVDAPGQPITLEALVDARFAGLLAMWRRQRTGDPGRDLQAAVASLEAASGPARLDAAASWLTQLSAASNRIRHKRELGDAGRLRQELAALEPSQREAIETGSTTEALTLLYGMDRGL